MQADPLSRFIGYSDLLAPNGFIKPTLEPEKKKTIIVEERRVNKFGGEEYIRYARGKFLGKGGFAKCYEMKELATGKNYAGKIVAKSTLTKARSVQKLKAEIRIHKSLSHQHIVKFEKYFEDAENVYILLEMCNHRSMMELLKKRKFLSESEVRYYMMQLISALSYMHERKIIHRDLKLGNLFLSDMQVKIGDFGLATQLEHEDERKRTICGTPNYIAPEILCGRNGHSFEVDIWAVGIIIYTLLIGVPPFETSDVENTYKRIRANLYSFPEQPALGADTKNLITRLLHPIPESRPSINEILAHPFFVDYSIPRWLPATALEVAPTSFGTTKREPFQERSNTIDNSNAADNKNSFGKRPTYQFDDKAFEKPLPIQKNKVLKLIPTQNENEMQDIGARLTKTRISQPIQPQTYRNVPPEGFHSELHGFPFEEKVEDVVMLDEKRYPAPTSSTRRVHPYGTYQPGEPYQETSLPQSVQSVVHSGQQISHYGQYGYAQQQHIQPQTSGLTQTNAQSESWDGLAAMHHTLATSFLGSTEVLPKATSHSHTVGDVWVLKWVDYSNKYGLGYQLSDATVGAYFNDSSKMILSPDHKQTEYLETVRLPSGKRKQESVVFSTQAPQYPEKLQKKVTLLHYFKNYLQEHSKVADEEFSAASVPLVYVQKWMRTKNAIIFRLSNKTVQVNFFDHTKLMLSSEAQVVTYINKQKEKSTQTLAYITEEGDPELVNRLKYTRDILLYLLSKNKKEDASRRSPSL